MDKPERLREFFSPPHAASQFQALEGTEAFLAQANRVQLSRLGLDFLTLTSGVEADLPPANCYREDFCLNGRGEKFIRGASVQLSREESAVIAPNVEIHARLESGFQCLILRVDPAALKRKLESFLGRRLNREIEFAERITFRNPVAQNLRRSVLFLTHELDSSDSQMPALALGEFEDYLLLLFLSANPNNYSDTLRKPESPSGPWHVRVVEDYLGANWNKAVSVEEIAAVAGVSVRSVFHGFRNSRGYSPMAFLKDIRLQKAREMLERAEADATVAGVANCCRFLSHGHFSREYERRFGEYPSATLRRSQGRE